MNHPMKNIRIEKLTLNVGAGKNQQVLEKGLKLIESIAGVPPVKTITQKRIQAWGLRPGLPIGCKITLRGEKAAELLPRLLAAKEKTLRSSQMGPGNVSFGIHEYIDVPGVNYDPDIGIMGFEVCVTLERPGYGVKRRRAHRAKVGNKHLITKEDTVAYMKETYQVQVDAS
ncbi:50S ribosomal protein L5 [Candidatus Woesearchaeota archaeon CG_4_10_14_0_2_um_filter_57_5]|nr:MAG: 50S ribosomal protein L5 [Candidatus Woesearchaeota archaeon CG1_02_57_44]PIN69232.1 MAG: 50S ribosomal protein L5 [Candidatus Woesearchaeota archaeon CG11_big_fil_rev_8_21_14_0_20_57_5]PIZ52805.1 MAG: 50S ribosomal protein L5 [Candidatus Woesearchaeota archaeon CG_4_10_14_0_2_um_filter_57_5]